MAEKTLPRRGIRLRGNRWDSQRNPRASEIRNDLANVRLGLRRLSRVSHFETLVKRLVKHCAHLSPDPAWPEIGKLDFEGDAENLKTWIEKILITEPPSANIAASWFGIFDSLGPDGRASSSLYMAGAETYDRGDDGSWACSPVYFPEHRYAESAVLRSISGLLAGRDNGVSWLGSYMLPLAYAALAVKKAERSIPADIWLRGRAARAVAVGFDSGDFVTLPEI